MPDPAEKHIMSNGCQVPLGKPVQCNIPGAALLYNEFIVYSVEQVKMKYLLKVKFNHK